jgi:hypothetical protein
MIISLMGHSDGEDAQTLFSRSIFPGHTIYYLPDLVFGQMSPL